MERSRPRDIRASKLAHRPIGPRILIPGFPQWAWHQNERAIILFVSYATAMAIGVMTWGTMIGLGILAFAFATHAFSAADAIRQYAFPGFGRAIPAITASAGLGSICYGPALVMASFYAWPITLDERPRDGYLVNRLAYRDESPEPGETVWLRPARGARPKIARIVAGPGQRVEWSDDHFRVDDKVVQESLFRVAGSPGDFKITIPDRHVLVSFGADPRRGSGLPGGWEIIDRADIRGRAWARSYPIWDRQLLR